MRNEKYTKLGFAAAALLLAAPLPALAQGAACKPAALGGTHTRPPYPAVSQRLGEHGRVELQVAVTRDGVAGDMKVAHSSGEARLDEAAIAHVRQAWQWVPGHCLPAQVRVGITFTLRDVGARPPKTADTDDEVVSSASRIPG